MAGALVNGERGRVTTADAQARHVSLTASGPIVQLWELQDSRDILWYAEELGHTRLEIV
jgi:hypothetical protein